MGSIVHRDDEIALQAIVCIWFPLMKFASRNNWRAESASNFRSRLRHENTCAYLGTEDLQLKFASVVISNSSRTVA